MHDEDRIGCPTIDGKECPAAGEEERIQSSRPGRPVDVRLARSKREVLLTATDARPPSAPVLPVAVRLPPTNRDILLTSTADRPRTAAFLDDEEPSMDTTRPTHS